MLRDPVCGQQVSRDTPFKLELDGRVLYFCSEECLEDFQEDPGAYLEPMEEESSRRPGE